MKLLSGVKEKRVSMSYQVARLIAKQIETCLTTLGVTGFSHISKHSSHLKMGAAASVAELQKNAQSNSSNHSPMNFDGGDTLAVFAEEMIRRSPKVEGLTLLLESESGRESFSQFLRNDYAQENVWFFKAVDEMRGKPPSDADFVRDAEFLISTYLSPESNSTVPVSNELKENLAQMMTGGNGATQGDVLDALIAAQYEAINIMALSAFPKFLLSKYYVKPSTEGLEVLEEVKDSMEIVAPNSSEDITAENSIQTKMSMELDKMLAGTSWLSGLLSSIESLPVCVSLAAASHTMRGFPLIYVNAAFETTTGYDRSEILGQNCRFLQKGRQEGHEAETESIARLTEALREAKPLKVAITNWRKDGSAFRNLLAIKPIMDQNGDYAFVLGIQFDIGNKDASARKMKMIDDLFRALPDSVVANPEHLRPQSNETQHK